MIGQEVFNKMIQGAKCCKYSSMSYIEFDDCVNADILYNRDGFYILHDGSKSPEMLYFAADDFNDVIRVIKELTSHELRLHFVPREYAVQLEELGFYEWGEYVDYWNDSLVDTLTRFHSISEPEYLTIGECEEASLLSRRCRLQSRGFEGESTEWFIEWVNENKVIIQRKDLELAGFCCVSIYNEGTVLWIRELAVDPAFQRTGVGKRLMEQAIKYGVDNGAKKGFLAADILNENAIGLYRKYDFQRKGTDSELQMIRG